MQDGSARWDFSDGLVLRVSIYAPLLRLFQENRTVYVAEESPVTFGPAKQHVRSQQGLDQFL